MTQTKITIISGFLGAGKTTLIRKLLAEAYKDEKVVLIENEFGEIGVDGGFLQEAGVEVKEMNSGCICCSLVGDFEAALAQVIDTYAPQRILIEPSGVGKLSDVAGAVGRLQADVVVAGKAVVADAGKCRMYLKNFGEFYGDQIDSAKAIILSRTQGMDAQKLADTVTLLRTRNPQATVVTTPWDALTGAQLAEAIAGGAATDVFVSEAEAEVRHAHAHDASCTCNHAHGEAHDDAHAHDASCTCNHAHGEAHDDAHAHDASCTCNHAHGDAHDDAHAHDASCACNHAHDEAHDEAHAHDASCACNHAHGEAHDEAHAHDASCACNHAHGEAHDDAHTHDDAHAHDASCACNHAHGDAHDDAHAHDASCACNHAHGEAHGHHHADDVFESFGAQTPHAYVREELEAALVALDTGSYGTVLRAKGIVAAQDGIWLHFDYVPEECNVRCGTAAVTGCLCVIGAQLNREKLKALFAL